MSDEAPPPPPERKPRRKLAAPPRDGADRPATEPGGKRAPAREEGEPKPAAAPRKRKSPAAPPPTPAPARRGGPLLMALAVAAAVMSVDQITKLVALHALHLSELLEIEVADPWLNLRMAWNQGMNFGLFSSDENTTRWLLIGIALAICAWVAVWLWRAAPGRLGQVAAGLLIGGALGNVIDRLAYGAVADFLNMSLPGWRNPYSFNVADIAIFAGALGLVIQPGPGRDDADKTRDGGEKTR